MIGKLKGIIEEIATDHILIDVNGVCYLVYCSVNTIQKLQKSEAAELYIETHVREDQITLFGFGDKAEKACYLKLVTVKGVGPRMGLAIVGGVGAQRLPLAIASQDKAAFSAISGVGPKLANRIVTELKEKDFISIDTVQVGSTEIMQPNNSDDLQTAVQALQNLGISRSEAYTSVSKILSEEQNVGLSELIKKALKQSTK